MTPRKNHCQSTRQWFSHGCQFQLLPPKTGTIFKIYKARCICNLHFCNRSSVTAEWSLRRLHISLVASILKQLNLLKYMYTYILHLIIKLKIKVRIFGSCTLLVLWMKSYGAELFKRKIWKSIVNSIQSTCGEFPLYC